MQIIVPCEVEKTECATEYFPLFKIDKDFSPKVLELKIPNRLSLK